MDQLDSSKYTKIIKMMTLGKIIHHSKKVKETPEDSKVEQSDDSADSIEMRLQNSLLGDKETLLSDVSRYGEE